MDYKSIFENYQKLRTSYVNCQDTQKKEYQKLISGIRESLHKKSFQEYLQHYSELYEMWFFLTKEIDEVTISPFFMHKLNNKYINYAERTKIISISSTNNVLEIEDEEEFLIAASKEIPFPTISEDDVKNINRETSKYLEFSYISDLNKPYEIRTLIENLLGDVWTHIFQNRLEFLNKNSNVRDKIPLNIDTYFCRTWSLYELLNQISKTIDQVLQEGKSQKIKISSLSKENIEDTIENTDKICEHILDLYINTPSKEDTTNNWFPKFEVYRDIQLPHIIATSDHISYMFECRLMNAKKRNEYLKKVQTNIENNYKNLLNGTTLYDAISSYIHKSAKNDIVVKYNGHLFCPRVVLIFVISIFQEIIRKALTRSHTNIFFDIDKRYRDSGLTEKTILTKIRKDAKTYTLIYHYFEKPTSTTIKKKKKKLEEWQEELNKLRFGILDDYLFDLAEATQISFEETTVTSIKASKKPILS